MSAVDESDRARIQIVTKLFAAWSSGDVDAPQQYMTDDAILWDSVGGLKEGWPAIREYFGHGLERYPDLDPYQDVFNEIANDLAAARDKLSTAQRQELRNVSGMRYAADLSPDAFKGYVVDDGKGRIALNRLPASDDPMFDRTQRVRQRERLFLDTLDQHYEKFYVDAGDSYNSWRENSREEAIEIHELTKQAH